MTVRDAPPEPEPEPDAGSVRKRKLRRTVPVPSHDQLYREVGLVRTRGPASLAEERSDLPGLLIVANVISSGTNDASKIEDALRGAALRLGGIGTPAVEMLLGLTSDTRSLSVTERRTRAAAAYNYKTYEVFRTRFEPSLLMFVATYLRVLVDERHLAERARIVEAYYQRFVTGNPPDPRYIFGTEQIQFLPVYHFKTTGFLRGEIYSIRREPIGLARVLSNPSESRLKRLLKKPDRTYYLMGGRGGFYEGERAYVPPRWRVRIYRSLITKLLRIDLPKHK
jgi:hypothetical protein